MAPHSQELEPPINPGRFSLLLVPAHELAVADHIGRKDGSHSPLKAIHDHVGTPERRGQFYAVVW
jgi:hypothetical protein